jgi:hypothetical protein
VSTRLSDDRGAIAVLTAVLTVLLLGVSALAVDLGNMYARSGDAQKAADLAALAGAAVLVPQDDRRGQPGASDIARAREEAHRVLIENAVYSDDTGFDLPAAGHEVWTDGNPLNGEIGVDVGAMQVTVVVPPRTVHFGLARVFGFSESTVSARAVAEVRAPGQLLPFYLLDEDGCRTESQFMAQSPDSPDPLKLLNVPSDEPGAPVLEPGILSLTASNEITILGENFGPDGPDGMEVQFTLGGQNVIARNTSIKSLQITSTGPDSLVVTVPRRVRATPGDWVILVQNSDEVWGGTAPPEEPDLQLKLELRLRIPGAPIIDDCYDPNPSGNLGLFEPNTGVTDLRTNLINGLSGELRVDDEVTIGLSSLTVGATTDGLIRGPNARLLATSPTDCNGTRDVPGDITINNDLLSCFIDNQPPNHPGHSIEGTLAADCNDFPVDLNDHPGRSLRPTIYNSPRFFFVPVLEVPEPFVPTAPVDVPVREFRAVFLTDETEGDGVGTDPYTDATTDNGISLRGSTIDRITVYAFCPDELPNVVKEGGNGFPWQPGLPTAIRLVD